MRVVGVTGRLGIGDVTMELEPRDGLVALLGERRAVQAAQALVTQCVVGSNGHRRRLVREARVHVALPGAPTVFELDPSDESADLRRRLQEAMALDAESLALVWSGGAPDLTTAIARGARLLATRAGLGRVETLLDALAETPEGAEVLAARELEESAEAGSAALEPLGTRASRLARIERDLKVLRADAVVVQGDLEEATMNWTRERQDAETNLLAYRDRARELRARLREMEESGPGTPCPTCGKVLDEHYEAVVVQLREEWESVVQDGQWWKRRWDQLELKPEELRELENRAVRYHAAIQEASERAEQLRTGLGVHGEEQEVRPGPSEDLVARMEGLGDPAAAARALTGTARELLTVARTSLLSATSKMMNRLSGGRLVGLDSPDGATGALVPRPVSGAPGREDLAAAQVSAHLALARSLSKLGTPLESLLVGAPFGDMEEEDQIRGVALLRRLSRRFPQILVLPSAGVVDASPEMFEAVWEFRPEPELGLPALRPLLVGVGAVRMRTAVQRT